VSTVFSDIARLTSVKGRSGQDARIRIASLSFALALSLSLALASSAQAAFPGANGKIAFIKETHVGGSTQRDIYTVNPDGTALTRLTTDELSSDPVWSPDATKIAFHTLRHDPGCSFPCNSEIYVMNSDGSGQVRLTNSPADDTGPTWSPDGTKIAFASLSGPLGSTTQQIYVMNADGSNPANISNNSGHESDPVWSPDGTTIAFSAGFPPGSVYLMNPDGSNRRLLPGSYGGTVTSNFDWSPDSRYLAIEGHFEDSSGGVFVAKVADGSAQMITFDDEGGPAWSPDGKRIVFEDGICMPGGCGLGLVNPDGSARSKVPGSNGSEWYAPNWQRLPVAPYARPQSASPLSVSLVPLFRQCGTGASPVNGQHSPPLGTGSCNPPSPNSTVARVGAASTGSAALAVVPGDADATNGDQADVSITSHLDDVVTTTGLDYNPNPSGADLTEVVRLRLTDRDNNYGGTSGTSTDLDFAAPIDCVSTAGAEGATCDMATSADALIAGAIEEQRSTVAQAFRVRVYDSGVNGVRENGAGDDRILAHQGIYIP
jgi:Tol biopolymer transport system component